MTIGEAVAVLISSQSDKPTNQTQRFEDVRDRNGEPVFSFTRFALVCNACKAKGVLTASECPHMQHQRPAHQSLEKQLKIEALYKQRMADNARENLGMEVNDNGTYFEPKLLDHVFNVQPRITLTGNFISQVFISIDPVGGKHNPALPGKSDFTIMSFVPLSFTHMVLVGLDAIQASRISDYRDNVVDHIRRLRRLPGCRNATVNIIFENNATMEADWISEHIITNGEQNINWVSDKNLKRGVPTSPQTKRDMAILTRETMLKGMLCFADRDQLFTTMIKDDNGNPTNAIDQLKKLQDQLGRYAEIFTVGADPTQPVSSKFSGKMNGEKDDMAVCLQLGLYWIWATYTTTRQR